MSDARSRLIEQGLLKPLAPGEKPPRFPKTQDQRDEDRIRIDFIAKQLYNVFCSKAREIDPEMMVERTVYDTEEVPFKDLFRAQAAYVLSTYKDNERLRERVRRLEDVHKRE